MLCQLYPSGTPVISGAYQTILRIFFREFLEAVSQARLRLCKSSSPKGKQCFYPACLDKTSSWVYCATFCSNGYEWQANPRN